MKILIKCFVVWGFISNVSLAGTIVFQEEAAGYASTQDSYISTRDADFPWHEVSQIPVGDGLGSFPFKSHGMLRFDDIFGPGLIPVGATITSAELFLHTSTTILHGSMHRVLFTWEDDTLTWNAAGNGIQANDIEARSTPSALINPLPVGPNELSIDVTADIQAWANGTPNYGWVFLPEEKAPQDWGYASSKDTAPINNHPRLTVNFSGGSSSAVPEPSSKVLLLFCVLLLFIRNMKARLLLRGEAKKLGRLIK